MVIVQYLDVDSNGIYLSIAVKLFFSVDRTLGELVYVYFVAFVY